MHTGVIYKIDGLKSFATISDSLRHDPSAILAHLHPVLQDLNAYVNFQLQTDEEVNVAFRDLSCFCDRPTVCSCYNLRRCKFLSTVSKITGDVSI